MKRILLLLSLILFITGLYPDTEGILEIYPTSAGMAMSGNTISSEFAGYGVFFYNPALRHKDHSMSIYYEHKFLTGNLSQYNSAFITLPSIKNINAQIGYLNQIIGDIPVYPEFPTDVDSVDFDPLGYFSDNANIILFNIGYDLDPGEYSVYDISAGFNIKYIYHRIYDYTGQGSSIDAGSIVRLYPGRFTSKIGGVIKWSLVVKNPGGLSVKWDTPSATVNRRNMNIFTGLGYSNEIRMIDSEVYTEVNYSTAENAMLGISGGLTFRQFISVYSGLNIRKDYSDDYAISAPGGGISISTIGFDVYYSISGSDLGMNHSIGIGYSL
ncbi:MAG: hypothetical protein R6U31_05415 [bacterium]